MKTIVLLSGGMDSAVLAYKLKHEGHEVQALMVDYGQKHIREMSFAHQLTQELDIKHRIADLSALSETFLKGSSQTDKSVPVPEGRYDDESMKKTVVPNRNMLMLSVAGAWAISDGADAVAYAAHAGDHAIYPDCRPQFVSGMSRALLMCDWKQIRLYAPFLRKTKANLVSLGVTLKVPFEKTWSCYKGGDLHCGKCGTCTERIEAFKLAGVKDPTVYGKAKVTPKAKAKKSGSRRKKGKA